MYMSDDWKQQPPWAEREAGSWNFERVRKGEERLET